MFPAHGPQKHDDYMTPKAAWENIAHIIPTDKVIWEPFYGDGKSGEFLKELGFNVIHEDEDFFETNKGDVIISNPPFSKTKEVFQRLVQLNKPFILLLPCMKLITRYVADLFKDNENPLQIVIPRRRVHFTKHVNGKPVEGWKNATAFDCYYYCWKIGLPRDIVWLE
jgi:hypothetical protein